MRLQERLALAARARLGRIMQLKTKQKHLEVPQTVRDFWASGSKKEMSEMFRDLNFNKDVSGKHLSWGLVCASVSS